MSDTIRDQALVLSGQIPLLAGFAERLAALPLGEETDTDAEALANFSEGLADLLAWVRQQGDEAQAKLDSIRRSIGMRSEFH